MQYIFVGLMLNFYTLPPKLFITNYKRTWKNWTKNEKDHSVVGGEWYNWNKVQKRTSKVIPKNISFA